MTCKLTVQYNIVVKKLSTNGTKLTRKINILVVIFNDKTCFKYFIYSVMFFFIKCNGPFVAKLKFNTYKFYRNWSFCCKIITQSKP